MIRIEELKILEEDPQTEVIISLETQLMLEILMNAQTSQMNNSCYRKTKGNRMVNQETFRSNLVKHKVYQVCNFKMMDKMTI